MGMSVSDLATIAGAQAISPAIPQWVPEAARQYLAHTAAGLSLRQIARADGQAPSTVCRRVRAIEARRDEPLYDEALTALSAIATPSRPKTDAQTSHDDRPPHNRATKELTFMTAPFRSPLTDENTIAREARRILRRLCETDAVLAVARDLDKAVVLRPGPDG